MAIRISRLNLWGIIAGFSYGLCLRLLFDMKNAPQAGAVMSVGFVFFVPLALGILAVSFAEKPSWKYSIFGPWVPILLFVAATGLLGWEGMICIVMALPVFLLMGSLGGVITKLVLKLRKSQRTYAFIGFLLLPVMSAGIESRFPLPESQRTVPTQIVINAPAEIVWKNIIRIPKIKPEEHHSSFFQSMGFPKPVEATLSHEGVGGVRHASFEGGLVFIETITAWQDQQRLVFSIKANTESIPPTTLDRHVTIGGEYFDMLEGEYQIESLDENRVTLHLSSKQRLSTRFNGYAALWTEAVMRSIQEYILVIIKQRCEAEV